MSKLTELWGQMAELKARRAKILEVRAMVRQEAAEHDGARWRPAEAELAGLSAETAQALRDVDARLRMAREMIIAARLNRGDKPDCPKGVISAWWPFLGDGRQHDENETQETESCTKK